MGFDGFPPKVRFTSVPDPVFGALLEQIGDLAELKCTLRLIWLLQHAKGYPRTVGSRELLADGVLAKALSAAGKNPATEVRRGVMLAVQRGTFLSRPEGQGVEGNLYALNTEAGRKALAGISQGKAPEWDSAPPEPAPGTVERPNIFALYEDNVGMLSPMMAEQLKEAEEAYSQSWIEDAFREAVSANARNWRYIATILERWEREGRDDGRPGGYLKKAGNQRYLGR